MTRSSPSLSTKLFLVLVFLSIVVVPASAVILPPVADPNIQPEGDTNFFFWNDSGTVAHPNAFKTYPQLQDSKLYSATVSASTGEVTVGDWVTDPFVYGKTMSPGLTRYRIYANVSSDVGVTTLDFMPFIHYANGTDARLFYGIARTVDINSPTPIGTATSTEYLVSYARRNYTIFEPGSSLIIRVNASTTSVVSRTVYFSVAGTNAASMATIGYWQMAPGVDVDTPPTMETSEMTIAIVAGFIGGFFAILYWRRRYKK